MVDLSQLLAELPVRVVSSLVTAAIIGGGALLIPPIRRLILFKRHEFSFLGLPAGSTWDVQWENLRVTIAAKAIHNDYLDGVSVKTNDRNPAKLFEKLVVSEELHVIAGPPRWLLKLGSIVRTRANDAREYAVNVIIFRRRF